MLLQGKTAVVTGGSRGIGLAIVKRFLAEGANVALCGSRPETAQKAVDAILSENPDAPVMGLSPDLTDEAAVEAAFASAKERFGGLDIVCNNAGISQSTPLGDYTADDFDKVIDINIKSVLNGCQAASRLLSAGGVIINTSSMVSKNGQPSGVGYPMSKFAVNGITASLAPRARPGGHPRERRRTGRHRHRHGRRASRGDDQAHRGRHPHEARRHARRRRELLRFPRERPRRLRDR